MPAPQTTDQTLKPVDPGSREGEEQLRALALEQIQRKRRFQGHAVGYAAVALVLIVVWAISEYHNAGGWPSDGFSQSSGIAHVWNIWIIYPVLGLGLILALEAWNTYGRKPVSESEVRREMDRLTH